jgi:hypothetical protein
VFGEEIEAHRQARCRARPVGLPLDGHRPAIDSRVARGGARAAVASRAAAGRRGAA